MDYRDTHGQGKPQCDQAISHIVLDRQWLYLPTQLMQLAGTDPLPAAKSESLNHGYNSDIAKKLMLKALSQICVCDVRIRWPKPTEMDQLGFQLCVSVHKL